MPIGVNVSPEPYYRVKIMPEQMYKIGDIAKQSGFSIQTLRYYEKENLIQPDARTESGYRLYKNTIYDELKLISHLKSLGFSLSEIKELNEMCSSGNAHKKDVKEKATIKLEQLNEKYETLKEIKDRLENAIARCPGDTSGISGCPIIESDLVATA